MGKGLVNAVILAGILLSVPLAAMAQSGDLTLDQGRLFQADYDGGAGSMGSGRGIGFQANTDFSINAIAINLSVPESATSVEYEFEIYASPDGRSAGALLASTTFFLSAGEGYQPQNFAFEFTNSSFYVINFSRVDNAVLDQLGTIYSWEDPAPFNPPYVPFDYGVLTLLEGFESAFPEADNPLVPHFRLSLGEGQVEPPEPPVTPQPIPTLPLTGLMLLSCLLGLLGARRLRTRVA